MRLSLAHLFITSLLVAAWQIACGVEAAARFDGDDFESLNSVSAGNHRFKDVDFAHDILPVLRSKCASCHSKGNHKGGLSLENRGNLIQSGVVEPGDSGSSELMLRIRSDEPDYQMPPDGHRLSAEQIKQFARWIDKGAIWPEELVLGRAKIARPLSLREVQVPANVHPIDYLLKEYARKKTVEFPTELTDRQFLRRAKLDLLGSLPNVDEIQDFENATSINKRQELIREILQLDEQYAGHWMTFWNDLLRNDYAGTGFIDGGRKQITSWLHRALLENKPYDQFVRELIDADEDSVGFIKGIKWRGNVNASQIQPLQFSQNVSQVFLGINMKCASCHDSFIDNWKLEDAYGLAAIVSDKPLEMHRCDVPLNQKASSKFVFAELGEIRQADPRKKRLQMLSQLMTSPKNGRFSRTVVNRLWERLVGRGLVHPVDVMANTAWSETLLDYLADDFVRHGYDIKRTLELIATSKVYSMQSVPISDEVYASQDYVFRGVLKKRMTAEQFVDAVWTLTGAAPTKIEAPIKGRDEMSVRASLVQSNSLMRSLGRPNREQVVTTRPRGLSTLQALDLLNGPLLNQWLADGSKIWFERQQEMGWSDRQLMCQMFQAAVGRMPLENEADSMVFASSDKLHSIEDVLWIVIMLPEFQFVR